MIPGNPLTLELLLGPAMRARWHTVHFVVTRLCPSCRLHPLFFRSVVLGLLNQLLWILQPWKENLSTAAFNIIHICYFLEWIEIYCNLKNSKQEI
jgi:hypothetical protein